MFRNLSSAYALILILSTLPIQPAAQASTASYRVEVSTDAIIFHRANTREADYGVTLNVTGPDDYFFQQSFTPAEAVYFSIITRDGESLHDGHYNYELARHAPQQNREEQPSTLNSEPLKLGTARQSGNFSITKGHITPVSMQEGPLQRDVVIVDDQIIQGKLCAGLDCVNGENFNFDTLRLKENNLRIRFFDTSNSASFPTTDWQLTANDTTNGGANRFSIEDLTGGTVPFTTEATAPDHSLFIDNSGRIGMGTSTPNLDIHIVSGNTPAVRLDQDASLGFPAQTWDIGSNESAFFIRDTSQVQIPFRIIPGAPTGSIHVDSFGDLGLGTIAPASEVHIQRNDNGPAITLQSIGTPNRSWQNALRDSDGDYTIDDTDTIATEVIVRAGGNVEIAGTLISMSPLNLPQAALRNPERTMPLDQLARYIARYQQLPNLSTSQSQSFSFKSEAAPQGHDILAFQMRLLEKIQELTMHTIAQQERIEALERQVQQLTNR